HPAYSSGNFRSCGGLVPGAMGQAGTQYRELAFSIGCPIKTKGEQALNKSQQYAADGRRTPFPWLLRRHSKVAAVLSVTFTRLICSSLFHVTACLMKRILRSLA